MTNTAAPAAGVVPNGRQFDKGLVASAESARRAAPALAALSSEQKNAALEAIAESLVEHGDSILAANQKDMAAAAADGMSDSMQDRLRLDYDRIAGIAAAVRELIALGSDRIGYRSPKPAQRAADIPRAGPAGSLRGQFLRADPTLP